MSSITGLLAELQRDKKRRSETESASRLKSQESATNAPNPTRNQKSVCQMHVPADKDPHIRFSLLFPLPPHQGRAWDFAWCRILHETHIRRRRRRSALCHVDETDTLDDLLPFFFFCWAELTRDGRASCILGYYSVEIVRARTERVFECVGP